ncbi:uncharacterized protein LOC114517994 [Dendronephthya gigantea]|uniref:uncharacterized protein LOC114517994 n=1 Tax=Dendronephthya gigantea TaxID=151771 RepID=UPI0010695490|nr:uncharacterized protein LOC114517994 [Dendronephthya gigantea]
MKGPSLLLLFVNCFHLVWGECQNSTINDCNKSLYKELITVGNCTICVCRKGFTQDVNLGGCRPCSVCKYPRAIVKNCTASIDTVCDHCPKTHFYTETGCKKCQECEHGVLEPCGSKQDTVCAPQITMPPTTILQKISTTVSNESDGYRDTRENNHDCKQNKIWIILVIVESIIIFVIVVWLFCRNCNNSRLYGLTDTSSLATSLSSLMLNPKSKWPDITCLTEEERETAINVLPGGYVEKLGELLNPTVPNNWIILAYHFKLTQNEVNNIKISSPNCTQELLYLLGSKNTTVERLWRGLKAIKRDDACLEFVNFMKKERNDDKSAIVFINDCD